MKSAAATKPVESTDTPPQSRLWHIAKLALEKRRKPDFEAAFKEFESAVMADKEMLQAALRFYLRHTAETMSGGQEQIDNLSRSVTRHSVVHGGVGLAKVAHQYDSASPIRESSKAYLDAAKRGAKTIAITVFDTFRVRDGRSLRKVQFHELSKLARSNEYEARIMRYIQATVESKMANPDPFAYIPDLVSEDVIEQAIQFSKVADNAQ